MSETIIWKVIEPIISKDGDCSRHEDKYQQGIPDISYGVNKINGWIESKFIDKWPRSGVVKLRKYTKKQRNWMIRRHNAGGHCLIILLVGKDIGSREFIIFPGFYAQSLGYTTRIEMYQNCIWKGADKRLKANIINILSQY